jgi:hypothetical protein
MSSQAHADRLGHAITGTGLAEPVNANFMDNRVSLLIRVKAGVEQQWNDLIKNILILTEFFNKETHSWHAHICRTYFLRQVGKEKKLVFGWNITITAMDMDTALNEVVRVVHGGDPEPSEENPNELTEFPLVGAPRNRNIPGSTGKGASTIGGSSDFRPPRR